MNRKELLHEQYEDALFALLMDAVADSEGAKALEENSRLQAEPHFQMPDSVDNRSLQTIHRHFAKLKRRSVQKYTARALGKAMIAVSVASTLFFTAFATSETVRLNTLNLVSEAFPEKTDFQFIPKADEVDTPQISATWVPDGYTFFADESGVYGKNSWSVYRNENNGFIHIMRFDARSGTVSLDTESAQTHIQEINGQKATVILKENEIQIIWGIESDATFIRILGIGITEEDLIHVANTVKYE